jgi:hypothetical protein
LLAQAVALGDLLPVSGMRVTAVSLLDGKPLGDPVVSDAQGRYKVEVPESLAGNMLLQARVPKNEDVRLQYDLVTKPDAAQQTFDEDAAVVTRFLQQCYVGKIDELLLNGSKALERGGTYFNIINANPFLKPVLEELIGVMEKAGTKDLPEADRLALANRLSNILLYHFDLQGAQTLNDGTGWRGPAEPALPVMRQVLLQFREAATAKMRENPKFFETQPYMVAANEAAKAAGQPPYVIKKPSDLGDFVVKALFFVQTTTSRVTTMRGVAASIGIPDDPVYHFDAAVTGLTNSIGFTLITNAEAKKAMVDAINQGAKK